MVNAISSEKPNSAAYEHILQVMGARTSLISVTLFFWFLVYFLFPKSCYLLFLILFLVIFSYFYHFFSFCFIAV